MSETQYRESGISNMRRPPGSINRSSVVQTHKQQPSSTQHHFASQNDDDLPNASIERLQIEVSHNPAQDIMGKTYSIEMTNDSHHNTFRAMENIDIGSKEIGTISTNSRANDAKTRLARENYLNTLYTNAIGNKTNVLKKNCDDIAQQLVKSLALEREKQKQKPYINVNMASPETTKHGRVNQNYTAHMSNEELELASDQRSQFRLRNVANPRVDLSLKSIRQAKLNSVKSRVTVQSIDQQSSRREGDSMIFTDQALSRPQFQTIQQIDNHFSPKPKLLPRLGGGKAYGHDRHFAVREYNETVTLQQQQSKASMYDSFVLNGKPTNIGRNVMNNSLTLNTQQIATKLHYAGKRNGSQNKFYTKTSLGKYIDEHGNNNTAQRFLSTQISSSIMQKKSPKVARKQKLDMSSEKEMVLARRREVESMLKSYENSFTDKVSRTSELDRYQDDDIANIQMQTRRLNKLSSDSFIDRNDRINTISEKGNKQMFEDQISESIREDSEIPSSQQNHGIFKMPKDVSNKMQSPNARQRAAQYTMRLSPKKTQKKTHPLNMNVSMTEKKTLDPDQIPQSIIVNGQDPRQTQKCGRFYEDKVKHLYRSVDTHQLRIEQNPILCTDNSSAEIKVFSTGSSKSKHVSPPFGPTSNTQILQKSPKKASYRDQVRKKHKTDKKHQDLIQSPLGKTIVNLQNVTINDLTATHQKQTVQNSASKTAYKDQLSGLLNKPLHKLAHKAQDTAHHDHMKKREVLLAEIKKTEKMIRERRRECAKMHQKGMTAHKQLEEQIDLNNRITNIINTQALREVQGGASLGMIHQKSKKQHNGIFDIEEDVTTLSDKITIDEKMRLSGMQNHSEEVKETQDTLKIQVHKRVFDNSGMKSPVKNGLYQIQREDGSQLDFNNLQSESQFTMQFETPEGSPRNMDSGLSTDELTIQEQSDVANLYKVKFQQDANILNNRTFRETNACKQKIHEIKKQIKAMQQENLGLERSIKIIKKVVDQTTTEKSKTDAIELRRLRAQQSGKNMPAPTLKTQVQAITADADDLSVWSKSYGGTTNGEKVKKSGQSAEMQKLDKIVMIIPQLVNAKKVWDSVMANLMVLKAGLGKGAQYISLFIIDIPMQRLVMKGNSNQKRYYKQFAMDGQNLTAIFLNEKEYAPPTFSSIKDARMATQNQQSMTIPIYNEEGALLVVLQAKKEVKNNNKVAGVSAFDSQQQSQELIKIEIETTVPDSKFQSPCISPEPRSPMKTDQSMANVQTDYHLSPYMSQKEVQDFETVSKKSKQDSVAKKSMQSKKSQNENFSNSDYMVMKVISLFTKVCMQSYQNREQSWQKVSQKRKYFKFVASLFRHKTVKDMIRDIKTEIPKLLGYSHCEIFSADKAEKQLYTFNVDKDDNIDKNEVFFGIELKHIEEDYLIPAHQIVCMPDTLGFSGYAYHKNAVCYVNNLSQKMSQSIQMPIPTTSAYDQKLFNSIAMAFVSNKLAQDVGYSEKIDNFLNMQKINNMIISSLEDEPFLGYPQAMGVIQLFDRQEKDIDREDFSRIFYARKLLGAMIVRAEWISTAFKTFLGLGLQKEMMDKQLADMITLNKAYKPTEECAMQNIRNDLKYLELSFKDLGFHAGADYSVLNYLPKYIDWDGKVDTSLHEHLEIYKTPKELEDEELKLKKEKERKKKLGIEDD